MIKKFQNLNVQSSPGLSLRVSQANSYASSPVLSHKTASLGPPENAETPAVDSLAAAFIKPLPCGTQGPRSCLQGSLKGLEIPEGPGKQGVPGEGGQKRMNLETPPQGKRSLESSPRRDESSRLSSDATRESEAQRNRECSPKNLATILRTSGPPPSRTTSARLPSRNDLMSQVTRTTWARHTTK